MLLFYREEQALKAVLYIVWRLRDGSGGVDGTLGHLAAE